MNTILYLANGTLNSVNLEYDAATSVFSAYIEPKSFVVNVLINSKPFLLKKGLNEFEKHVCINRDSQIAITENHYGEASRKFSFTFSDLLEFESTATPSLLGVYPKTTFIPDGENDYTATAPSYMATVDDSADYTPNVLQFQFSDNRPELANRTKLVQLDWATLTANPTNAQTYSYAEQHDLNGSLYNLQIITTVTAETITFHFSNAHGGSNMYGKYTDIQLQYN